MNSIRSYIGSDAGQAQYVNTLVDRRCKHSGKDSKDRAAVCVLCLCNGHVKEMGLHLQNYPKRQPADEETWSSYKYNVNPCYLIISLEKVTSLTYDAGPTRDLAGEALRRGSSHITDQMRLIFSMPAKYGGLGILEPESVRALALVGI